MKFCIYCKNTGVMVNGVKCTHCKPEENMLETIDFSCLSIPIAYRGAIFSKELIQSGIQGGYYRFMEDLYLDITNLKELNTSILICSPPKSSKTVLAYSCIQTLYKKDRAIFGLYDLSEIECIMRDIDRNKETAFLNKDERETVTNLYNAKVIFVKIPDKLEFSFPDTIAQIIDRRVRRGGTTIFLFNKRWEDLLRIDSQNTLRAMEGDGSFKSLMVKEFWREG